MKNQINIVQHANLLAESYARITGRVLIEALQANTSPQACADLLWQTPVAIVSHGVETDPVFNYGNALALKLFAYDWDEFTALPSRFSAEQDQREARDSLLKQVTEHGFFDGYHGVRVSKQGQRFRIIDATIWNVIDADGFKHGQAAIIRHYLPINQNQ